MTEVLSAVRHQELCKTDFDLDTVPATSIMTHTALRRHAGWQSLGGARRGFLVLVRNCTAAEQTDLCKSQDNVFAHDRFRFFCRLHQSFAKAALVRDDISCRCTLNRVP